MIPEFTVPSDKPALQRFLGMINFYRKFLRGAARVLAPLTDALKGSRAHPSSTISSDLFSSRRFRLSCGCCVAAED